MKSNLFFSLLITCFQVFCQENIPVGTWRTHFNYEKAIALEKADEKIYCLTEQGLFYFDSGENSTTKLTKVDGLSDAGITSIAYNDQLDLLAVGYFNGNIDLVRSNEILNIVTLKNSSITEDKQINHIVFFEKKVYLSASFGVLVLNPETGEVEEVFQNLGENGSQLSIAQTLFLNNTIYLATSEGVLSARTDSNLNLQDFNNWGRFDDSVVHDESLISLSEVSGNVYASTSNTVFVLSNNVWTNTGFNAGGESILKIKRGINELIIVTESTVQLLASDGSTSPLALETRDQPRDVIQETEQIFWYADFGRGLSLNDAGNVTRIVPNGIFPIDIARLEFVNGTMIAFPESVASSTTPLNNTLGYAQFTDGTWFNVAPDQLLGIDDITDAVALNEGNLILSSFGHGIIELATTTIYDETNSPLVNNNPADRNVLVSTMDVDPDGNIWVGQVSTSSLLKFSPDKTWQDFNLGIAAAQNPLNIKVDELGQIWMIPQLNFSGMIGYNPETGITRYFTSSSGGLPNSKVTDLEIDLSGQVWIGTESGLAFLPFIFGVIDDTSVEAIEPIFENRILFEGEKINAIEVDAGNRKWIATADGLWLFEDDGDVLVHNFNSENSPLPSNTITDIKTNTTTGEVFIATDKGLVSFRSDAVKGEVFHQNVKIFPNPVVPGYLGLVGISGLAEDVVLKITDVSGKLVREINAAGGGASWDIADYNGVRAQTGVYLIFSSNDDGSETFVGKVAVVN